MKIAYTFVISDLFHYGHLQLLKAAKDKSDKLICGVLTDEAVANSGQASISNFEERTHVIEAIRYVDEVMAQDNQNPFANLCLLREQYPNDEIILVLGENWEAIPGSPSLSSINVQLKKQRFYEKLSHQKVACNVIKKHFGSLPTLDTFTDFFVEQDFAHFSKRKKDFIVSTKANTLQKLKPLLKHSKIEKMYVFTTFDWHHFSEDVLDDIRAKFSSNLVVRSSSINEDTLTESKAGHFESVINVKVGDKQAVKAAIEKVIASYPDEGDSFLTHNQVLVQKYTQDVVLSGVLLTRDMVTNGPYYVVNYTKGNQTDQITSGQSGHLLKIFKHAHHRKLDKAWQVLIQAVQEIETIIPELPLDIEFAITQDMQCVIFQVRPFAAKVNQASINADRLESEIFAQAKRFAYYQQVSRIEPNQGLLFSDMAFWNPSELIGPNPRDLAYSLFEHLIMRKAWRVGLEPLGYKPVNANANLMVRFANKPYINVNLAFWALTPNCINDSLAKKLNTIFIKQLQHKPFLHDKIEFEIALSCYDFSVEQRIQALTEFNIAESEQQLIKQSLITFTKELIDGFSQAKNTYQNQMASLDEHIQNIQNDDEDLVGKIQKQLNVCEEIGTTPFAGAARYAFVAESLLRSLVHEHVISQQSFDAIVQSFTTIASTLKEKMHALNQGQISRDTFNETFGHLRAGTYDIERPRYDQMHDLSSQEQPCKSSPISIEIKDELDAYLQESPLKLDFESFYAFTKDAIELRELIKFKYTRLISDTLEDIKSIAVSIGISPSLISYLNLTEILTLEGDVKALCTQKQEAFELKSQMILPPILKEEADFTMMYYPSTKPNFVTQQKIFGQVVVLGKQNQQDLKDKIVMIENADPGYHWIFSKGIKGLVTKYGGVASHMAICSAELNIPAAIGCGELFDTLARSKNLHLDCQLEKIESSL